MRNILQRNLLFLDSFIFSHQIGLCISFYYIFLCTEAGCEVIVSWLILLAVQCCVCVCVCVRRSTELSRAWEPDAADLAPRGGVGSEEHCQRPLPGPQPHREQESCRYIQNICKYMQEYINIKLCWLGICAKMLSWKLLICFADMIRMRTLDSNSKSCSILWGDIWTI